MIESATIPVNSSPISYTRQNAHSYINSLVNDIRLGQHRRWLEIDYAMISTALSTGDIQEAEILSGRDALYNFATQAKRDGDTDASRVALHYARRLASLTHRLEPSGIQPEIRDQEIREKVLAVIRTRLNGRGLNVQLLNALTSELARQGRDYAQTINWDNVGAAYEIIDRTNGHSDPSVWARIFFQSLEGDASKLEMLIKTEETIH